MASRPPPDDSNKENHHPDTQPPPTTEPPATIEYPTPQPASSPTRPAPHPHRPPIITPDRTNPPSRRPIQDTSPTSPPDNTSPDTASPPHDFKILLQLTHPETSDSNHTPPNEATITEILTATLHHHQFREPALSFVLHSVKHHQTKRRTKPQTGWASYYHVTLRPNPNQTDAFDAEIFYEQAVCLVLQQWHKHRNEQFFQPFPAPPNITYPCALFHPDTIQPVSTNPWTKHIHLLLPATNSFAEKARGILLGPTPNLFNASRRALDHLTEQIYLTFRPALTNPDNIPNRLYYPTVHSFRQDVGVRPAYYPNPNYNNRTKKNPSYKVYYISTTHEAIWKLLSRTNKDRKNAKPTHINGVPFEIIPFPTGPNTILPTIQDIFTTTREFKTLTTKRFKIPMETTHSDTIISLPTVKALIPLFPTHSPEPIAYRLALKPTPQTVGITSESLHQLPGLPIDSLLPLPSTDSPYINAIKEPATPAEPCPGLSAFKSRWSSFAEPPPTNSSATLTTLSRTTATTKKPRTSTNSTTSATPTDASTALLSQTSPTSTPTDHNDIDLMSDTTTDSTPNQDDSQLTDFGGLDEQIYQFIEEHASNHPAMRHRIETLLNVQPRPFHTFEDFRALVHDWDKHK